MSSQDGSFLDRLEVSDMAFALSAPFLQEIYSTVTDES